jgi:hypothetical protein
MLRMGRLAPIFAIIAAPMLASALPTLRGRALRRPVVGGVLATVLVLGSWQVAERFPSRQTSLSTWLNRNGSDVPGYPCEAVEFVRRSIAPSSGHIINNFTWGDTSPTSWGPRFKVFMDPRTQLYTAKLLAGDVSWG